MKNKLSRTSGGLLAVLLGWASSIQAAVFTVTNTADSGDGSLRQAMEEANGSPGADRIEFKIGSGAVTIQPKSSLPYLLDEVEIAGDTQPGFGGTPLVQLDGKLAGANVDGLVFYTGSEGSVTRSLAIFSFDGGGIRLTNVGSVTITGCYLGTDASGAAAFIGNRRGLVVAHSTSARVGGFDPPDANVISGNREEGVRLEGAGSTGNRIDGNFIGTAAGGAASLSNGGDGVRCVDNPQFNYFQANRIAFNGGAGVNVVAGHSIGIYQNSFQGNHGLAIDLAGDGITLNDLGDTDAGPNTLQNFPELTSALSDGSNLSVSGQLNSTAETTFVVELYRSEACDPSGHGAGQFFERFPLTTDSSGRASFSRTIAIGIPIGTVVSALATHPSGHTSELSKCEPVQGQRTNCLEVVCPANLEFPCEQPDGALVQYALPRGTDECTGEPLAWVCYPPYGLFPPGVTTVICRGPVTDNGEAAQCSFTISVTTNCPVVAQCLPLQCPTNLWTECQGPTGALVRWDFSASNACSRELITSCLPPSGSVFVPGVTEVICSAIGAGQTNECRFTVTVAGDCAPRLELVRLEGKTTLQWPVLATGYMLQSAEALGAWGNELAPPVQVGNRYEWTIPADAAKQRYYRLWRTLEPRIPLVKPAHTAVDSERAIPQQIVIKFQEGSHVRMRGGGPVFDPAGLSTRERTLLGRNGLTETQVALDVAAIQELLRPFPDIAWVRLVEPISESLIASNKNMGENMSGKELADLDLYFYLVRERMDAATAETLINRLNAFGSVEMAYAQPRVATPDILPETSIRLMRNQGYLDAAPIGIDARYAWNFAGARGENTRVVDVEFNWHLDHEDLPGRHFTGNGNAGPFPEHGTAVLGIMVGADNDYGVTGIVPNSGYGVQTHWPSLGVPGAILQSAAALSFGDVILIEAHSPGPSTGLACPCNCGQFEFVPQEFFAADRDAIESATARGIIVVEAAGNGSSNLDDPVYGGRLSRSDRTRAILVGASSGGGDLTTACFSNYGSGVDVHGWGDMVATLGYGDAPDLRANGDDARQWYTRGFGGTSSASPIVAGAALSIQGVLRARGLPPLGPERMLELLQSTGTRQPAGEPNPVGPLPNLRAALRALPVQDAEFVRYEPEVPMQLECGEAFTVRLTMRNTGQTTWKRENVEPRDGINRRHALSSQNPLNNRLWVGADRIALMRDEVAPGEEETFIIHAVAPMSPGAFIFQWRMVQDWVEWFGELTPAISIRVCPPQGFRPLAVGTRISGAPVVAANGDERLEVFAIGRSGQVLHLPQLARDGDYSNWEPLAGTGGLFVEQSLLAVGRNRDNRLEVFGWMNSGRYAHLWQNAANVQTSLGWSAVDRFDSILDPRFLNAPAVGRNSDGRLEVFGLSENGDLSHRFQNHPAGGPITWSVWFPLGSLPQGTPAVIRSGDRLHVFINSFDGPIRHRAQRGDAGGSWTEWENLGGGGFTSDPVAALRGDGRIEVLARRNDFALWSQTQLPDGTFPGAWTRLGGSLGGKPAVINNADGRLDVFVTTREGSVEHLEQTPGGSWSSWESLGGSAIRSDPAVGRNGGSGKLEVFVRGGDDGLWHQKQPVAGHWR